MSLIRLNFPVIEDHAERMRFYQALDKSLQREGYSYITHYRFEWVDTGKFCPDYIWVKPDLALLFALKYGIKPCPLD